LCSTGKKKKKTSSSKKSTDAEVDGELKQMNDVTNHNDDNGNHDIVNGCNGNGCVSPQPATPDAVTPRGAPVSGGRRGAIEDIKEEEDVVPDLPIYEDPSMYGGLRKLSRSKSNTGKKPRDEVASMSTSGP
jgi:hypothetical protein